MRNLRNHQNLNVTAPVGTRVALRFGERINEDGTAVFGIDSGSHTFPSELPTKATP